MRLALIGAGIAGAYLYRLLHSKGYPIDLFDKGADTACGISPCAWGTSRGFSDLLAAVGLDASAYVLARPEHLLIDGLRIGADLITFDKGRLIRDLLQGAAAKRSEPRGPYDRIIDATGAARAVLPAISDDIALNCIQVLVEADTTLENRIRLGSIGYAWCFPLSGNRYHIGCGTLTSDPGKILRDLGWVDNVPGNRVLCNCCASIRLTGPQYSQPFVVACSNCEVWGVGESIGCVAPLAGDGVVTGMKSAQILVDHWDDPTGYTKAILEEFGWMAGERQVLDRLRNNGHLRLADAWVLKKNSRRMGIRLGLREAVSLLAHLR
jgi:flavin-dependent dehydrogenase